MSDYQKMTPEFFNSLPQYKKELLLIERAFDIEFESASMMADYMIEKCNLDFQEAELHVLVEDGTYDMLDSLYQEAAEKTSGGAIDAIKKMIDSIIRFIQDTASKVKDKVSAVFAKGAASKLTAEDYLNSNTANMEVNMHYEKELAEIDKQLTNGQKMVQKISSSVGVDRGTLQGYVDTVNNYLHDLPKIACKAAKTAAVVGGVVIVAKNYKKIVTTLVDKIDDSRNYMMGVKKSVKGKDPAAEKEVVGAMAKLAQAKTTICSRICLGATALVGGSSSDLAAQSASAAAIKSRKGVSKRLANKSNKAYDRRTRALDREAKEKDKWDKNVQVARTVNDMIDADLAHGTDALKDANYYRKKAIETVFSKKK